MGGWLAARSASWVVLAMHVPQVASVEMRVDLGTGDIGVAQQFLDGGEIRSALDEVRGEGMSQGMR